MRQGDLEIKNSKDSWISAYYFRDVWINEFIYENKYETFKIVR